MCVIFLADKGRPSENMIRSGYESNSHGAGIAWREDGKVHWRKGLELGEILELAKKLPLPYVAHFRIASIGPQIATLTHPFVVDETASTRLVGETTTPVLFHNGTWSGWKAFCLDTASRVGKFPTGKWSDTRALAWIAHIYGTGILDVIDEKVVVFGLDRIEMFGSGWERETDEKIYTSNRAWKRQSYGYSYGNNSYRGTSLGHYPGMEDEDGTVEGTIVITEKKEEPKAGGTSTPFSLAQARSLRSKGEMTKNEFKRTKARFKEAYLKALSSVSAKTLMVDPRMTVLGPTVH